MQKHNFLNKTQSDTNPGAKGPTEWQSEDCARLLYLAQRLHRNWPKIALRMKPFSAVQIEECYKKIASRWGAGPWAQAEDLFLLGGAAEAQRVNWFEKSVRLARRSPENCFERWHWLHHKFSNRGSWSSEEQLIIFKLLEQHGFAWKQIGRSFPRRSSNSVKGLVHASLRKIKKSKALFWSLYQFARWPTFTNKKQKLKFEAQLGSKIRKVEQRFRQILPKIKAEFKGLNRLTQELVKRVFVMETGECELHRKLASQLFGKLATGEFLRSGRFPRFQTQKNVIFEFITSHLEIVDRVNLRCAKTETFPKYFKIENSIFLGQINFRPSAARSRNPPTGTVPPKAPSLPSRAERSPAPKPVSSLCEAKGNSNGKREFSLRLFKLHDVSEKYLAHLRWLEDFFGRHSESYISFERLLKEAFLIAQAQPFFN